MKNANFTKAFTFCCKQRWTVDRSTNLKEIMAQSTCKTQLSTYFEGNARLKLEWLT